MVTLRALPYFLFSIGAHQSVFGPSLHSATVAGEYFRPCHASETQNQIITMS